MYTRLERQEDCTDDYASDIKAAKWVVAGSSERRNCHSERLSCGFRGAELFSLANLASLQIEIFKVSLNWPRGIYDPSFHAMLETESILKMQKGAQNPFIDLRTRQFSLPSQLACFSLQMSIINIRTNECHVSVPLHNKNIKTFIPPNGFSGALALQAVVCFLWNLKRAVLQRQKKKTTRP